MSRSRASLYVAVWFHTGGDDDFRRLVDKCRYVDFSQNERCPFLSIAEELYRWSYWNICGSADDPVRIVGNSKSNWSFTKNI